MSKRTKPGESLSVTVGPLTSDRGRAYQIMQLFSDVPRTETAFYLHFQRLCHEDRNFLQRFYGLDTPDWPVFKAITRWWAVRTA